MGELGTLARTSGITLPLVKELAADDGAARRFRGWTATGHWMQEPGRAPQD